MDGVRELTGSERAAVARHRPRSRAQLHGWLRAVLGVHVPTRPVCERHVSPLDYLEHVFFERGGDALVWANRGGGKTFYGAVATLLDLLFKPGIEVRVLGGSLEQSRRMYGHLCNLLEKPGLRRQLAAEPTRRWVRLRNGSRAELLAQSETSVRGHRVQKLRCDEVEMFKRDVWSAAQLVTRSRRCGEVNARGTVEGLSTMHRPYGLMNELVQRSRREGYPRLFAWCVLDVMDACDLKQRCEDCELWGCCGGRAKRPEWGRGFVSVPDVIDQWRRTSRETFASEVLCRRPSRREAVLPAFDPAVHVRWLEPDARLTWVGGMDFGLREPLVMLWAQLRPLGGGEVRVEVIDEHVRRNMTTEQHVAVMARRGWPRPAWLGVDPTGDQRSSQTGLSTIEVLQRSGYRIKAVRTRLELGLEALQRRVEGMAGRRIAGGSSAASSAAGAVAGVDDDAEPARDAGGVGEGESDDAADASEDRPGADASLLAIHPRCETLIESLSGYHFDPERPQKREPVKDGHDHAVDALRYLVVNLDRVSGKVVARRY